MKQTLGKPFFKSCKESYVLFLCLEAQFAKQYCGTLGKATEGNEENPKKLFVVKLPEKTLLSFLGVSAHQIKIISTQEL